MKLKAVQVDELDHGNHELHFGIGLNFSQFLKIPFSSIESTEEIIRLFQETKNNIAIISKHLNDKS